MVHDVSRAGAPVDLQIGSDQAVRWSPKGLTLVTPTLVASPGPATRIIQACKASNEVSLELWFGRRLPPPHEDGRLLTLSGDYLNQNLMLGQDELRGPSRSYFVRLRTTMTDQVGKPDLSTPDGNGVAQADALRLHAVRVGGSGDLRRRGRILEIHGCGHARGVERGLPAGAGQ